MVHYLVTLGDSCLRVMVGHLMDRHDADGVDWMQISTSMVHDLVGFCNGGFAMENRDGMDGGDWVENVGAFGVEDVRAPVVDDLAALRVCRLGGNGVDKMRLLSQEVGWGGGAASQDGADDDLEKSKR